MSNTSKINVKLFKKLDSGDVDVEIKGLKNLGKRDVEFIADHIQKNKIQRLLLDRVTFADKSAFPVLSKALQSNQSIVDLSIRHTNITVRDSTHLSNILTYDAISPLKKLEFTDTNLGYRGTNSLLKQWFVKAKTSFFSRLFSRKQMRDARAEQKKNEDKGVVKKQNLSHLVLKDNKIDGEDMERLIPVLGKNQSIRHLDLSHNKLNHVGIKAVLGIVEENAAINQLVLKEVVQCHKDERKKTLNYMYTELRNNKQLEYLDISQNHTRGMSPVFAKFLQYNTSVVTLKCNANRMSDDDIGKMCGALQHNKTLRHLSLRNNPLGNKSIEYFLQLLGKHETLTNIEIREPDNEEGRELIRQLNVKLNRNKLLLSKTLTQSLSKIMIKDLYNIALEYLDAATQEL